MTAPRAADLPIGSVVATATRAWMKRSNESARTPKGSPFHEVWWIEATTHAVQVYDQAMQEALNAGAQVLRVGDGTDQ